MKKETIDGLQKVMENEHERKVSDDFYKGINDITTFSKNPDRMTALLNNELTTREAELLFDMLTAMFSKDDNYWYK